MASPLLLTTNPLLRREERNDLPRQILRRTSKKREMRHMLEVANAAAELEKLPAEDETIHAIMRGNFHGWDLVPAVLRLAKPALIDELCVATLGFNKQNAAELLALIDNQKIRSVCFVASCYFKHANPAEFGLLADGLRARGMRIVAVRSHAKILAMKLTDDRAIVVESSANLRSCNNIEQFAMTQSKALFQFHRQWIHQLADAGDQLPKKKSGKP